MIFGIVVAVVLIVLDQIAKQMAVSMLMPHGSLPAVAGVFEWLYIENDGAAFSLFAGRQGFLIVFTSIALLVLAFILLFRRPKDKMEAFSLLLIFSGGVGNLIDRIAQGYVVDYIHLLFMNFAVFNLADIYVTVGFALLIIAVVRGEIRAKREKQNANDVAEEKTDEQTVPELSSADNASEEVLDDGEA